MYIALLMLVLAYFLIKEFVPRAVGRIFLLFPKSQPRERPDRQQDEYG